MSHLKIRNALESRLKAFADTKSLPIVVENKSTIPTTSHFKCYVFHSPTGDPSIGAQHKRYKGMFRVVFYSTDINKGMGSIEALCQELADYFPRALQITKDSVVVHIEQTPSLYPAGFESNYVYVPVEIYYRADVITN